MDDKTPKDNFSIKFKINDAENYSITIVSNKEMSLNDAMGLRSRLDRMIKLFKDEVDYSPPKEEKRAYTKQKKGKRDFTKLKNQDLLILYSVAKDKTLSLKEKKEQVDIILNANGMNDLANSDSSIKDAICIKIPHEIKRRGLKV